MLSFEILDETGTPARSFDLSRAYAFGVDDTPVQAALRFRDGVLHVDHPGTESLGVAVQAAVPGAGRLMLKTALLPRRPEPYPLALELARQRIMLCLNKLEDWEAFDMPASDPVAREIEAAREAFTRALCAPRGPGEGVRSGAERLAREALALAVRAGEGLCLAHADRLLPRRASGRTYDDAARAYAALTQERLTPGAPVVIPGGGGAVVHGVPAVGCALTPTCFDETSQRVVQSGCDFVTVPMRWIDMEPGEGKYFYAHADRWIEWAVRTAKLPVVAGPLVDFRAATTPEWLFIWENDYETLRELVFEHVQAIVTRYRRTVSRWTVAGGLHVTSNFKLSLEQALDLTRLCVLLVRKLQPSAQVQVEIAEPWGEYHARDRRSAPPLYYAESVRQAGLPIDAFALRVQMGSSGPGQPARDMMAYSALLDRYGSLEKPIMLSCLGAPSGPAPAQDRQGDDPDDPQTAPLDPGEWRGPWTPQRQADWLLEAFAIACAKPYVQAVCWQDLCDPRGSSDDGAPEMPLGGLIAADGMPKPAAQRLAAIRQALRERRSPLSLSTRSPGGESAA